MGDKDPSGSAPWLRDLGLFGVIVADLVGYTGAGIAIGYFVWKKLGAPWWVIVLTSLAGLGLAMYRVYQLSARKPALPKETEAEDDRDQDARRERRME